MKTRLPLLLLWSLPVAALLFIVSLALWQTPLNVVWFQDGQKLAAVLPDPLWAGFTILGSGAGAYALMTPALVLGQPRWLAAAFLTLPIGGIATRLPKIFLESARPAGTLGVDPLHVIGEVLRHSSFPSGHSLTAFAFAALIIFLSRRAWLTAIVALPLAILIAFSRIAVGAHWPADVLAGAGLGWLCGALGAWLAIRWQGWNTTIGIRILACILVGNAIYLFFGDLGYPQVRWLQYLLGVIALLCSLSALLKPQLQAQNR